ncbi:MAG TPA: GNAT family N-acetyltransferase [Baekduia sp.]
MTELRLDRVRPDGRRAGVGVTSPAPRAVWEQVLASDPTALVTHTPTWLDFVCRAGDYEDASRLYELPGDRRLVLPMVRRRHLPGALAAEASFPPGFGMGGVLAPGGLQAGDAQVVFSDLARRDVVRTSLRPNPLNGDALAAGRPPGVAMVSLLANVLPLDGGFERVWKERFKSETRTAIRKAERCGLTVERDTSGRLVPVLYELYERSVDRWADQSHEPRALARWRGHRADPRRKFELMAEALGDACRVWVAWSDGRPAAAILVLQGINATYSRGMMDKELAGPLRANHLLHRLAIEEACMAGCRYYHMGESGFSASLMQFKSRFGARACAHAEYHVERVPITALDRRARGLVKRAIGFRENRLPDPGGR